MFTQRASCAFPNSFIASMAVAITTIKATIGALLNLNGPVRKCVFPPRSFASSAVNAEIYSNRLKAS